MKPILVPLSIILTLAIVIPSCLAAGRSRDIRLIQDANGTPPDQPSPFGYIDLPLPDNAAGSFSSWSTANVAADAYSQPAEHYELPPFSWHGDTQSHPPVHYSQVVPRFAEPMHHGYGHSSGAYGAYADPSHQTFRDEEPLLRPEASYHPAMDSQYYSYSYGTHASLDSYGSYPQPPFALQETQFEDQMAQSEPMSRLTMDRHSADVSPTRSSRAAADSRSNLPRRKRHHQHQSEKLIDFFTPHPASTEEQMQRELNRMVLRQEWEARRLSTDMDAAELAAQIAEIKICHPDMATSIGSLASRIVKAIVLPHDPAYYRMYSDQTHIFTSKITGLRTKYAREDLDQSPEMLRQELLANFRDLNPEVPLTVPHSDMDAEEEQLQFATTIWDDFVRTRLGGSAFQPGYKQLPLEQIAAEMATYQYGTLSPYQTIKYLRKFMLRVLQITPSQMVRLGKLQRDMGIRRNDEGRDTSGAQSSKARRAQGM